MHIVYGARQFQHIQPVNDCLKRSTFGKCLYRIVLSCVRELAQFLKGVATLPNDLK